MEKIILCRIAWMKYYEGSANIDIPRSGAKYIQKNKTGGEINTFKNRQNKVYAYFPNIGTPALINLDKNYLKGADLKGVTVVFCATHPTESGIRVVGWYKNATIYNEFKNSLSNKWGHVEALFKNVHLVPENDRVFHVPGTFGRSSLYYFSLHPERKALLEKLKLYIARKGEVASVSVKSKKKSGKGNAYQQDIEKRLKVEQEAISLAMEHYKNRYGKKFVKSVEPENKGWDLEVRTKQVKLNIEVKGLSGSHMNVELTPNEFYAFNKCSNNYHLFVANGVLTRKPVLRVFKFQSKGKMWVANDKSILRIAIRRSAVLNLK